MNSGTAASDIKASGRELICESVICCVYSCSPMQHLSPMSPLRFDEKENVSNCIQLKTSVIKGIKNQLLDQFPDIESWLNHIMPKKDPVKIVRW